MQSPGEAATHPAYPVGHKRPPVPLPPRKPHGDVVGEVAVGDEDREAAIDNSYSSGSPLPQAPRPSMMAA